ncbi:Gfo/Idh/MocA family protein, partial [candidate division KSB1 bacterium]
FLMTKNKKNGCNFHAIGTVAAAISGFPFVHTSRAQSVKPIKIGIDGCGGRGTGAASDALRAAPNVHLIALADPFRDRIDLCLKNLNDPKRRGGPLKGIEIKEDHIFAGLDGYTKLLETDIDYVILTEPPGFRSRSFEAAVEAGKHVFMEKPVATDPVGVRKVLKTAKKAREKGLSVCVGLDKRHSIRANETVNRIHDGGIGDILAGRLYFQSTGAWHRGSDPSWTPMEYQCRNWYYFCWLSGDQIVEQHIHEIDAMNWAMGGYPVKALANGGRQVRTDPKYGNIWDHISVDYEYPNGAHALSMSRHWRNCDVAHGNFVVGTKGRSNIDGEITGKNAWKWDGKMVTPKVYEHWELIESIRKGETMSQAEFGAYSALTAIMGRESAYTGKVVTWDEMLNSDLDLFPEKVEFGPVPKRAVPMPGYPRPR